MPKPEAWLARAALRAVIDLLNPVELPGMDLHLVGREDLACLLELIANALNPAAEA